MTNFTLIEGVISSGSGSLFYIQNSGDIFTGQNEIEIHASGDVAAYVAKVIEEGRLVMVKGIYKPLSNYIEAEMVNFIKDTRSIGEEMTRL